MSWPCFASARFVGAAVALLPASLALLGQGEGEAPASRPQTGAYAPLDVASVDAMFAASWAEKGMKPGGPASDAEWLRRATLSLNGVVPSAQEVSDFLKSAAPDKREKKVDELIARPEYAKHFGGEWTRLMVGRSTRPPRIDRNQFEEWVEDQFAANVPFSKLTTDLITASGPMEENPAVGFVARWLQTPGADGPKDLAGHTSKIFLGVQIQCARCHDHKYEQWKQDEFTEFASFFAVTSAKPAAKGDRTNPVVMDDPDRLARQNPAFRKLIRKRANETVEEFEKRAKEESVKLKKETIDRNVKNAERAKMGKERVDLAAVTPTPLRPLESGPLAVSMRVESDDVINEKDKTYDIDMKGTRVETTRRQRLAAWMTAPGNPYFSREIVNRTFGALFGYGLIDPIDDFRSDSRVAISPLLDALALDFEQSGFDFKRLVALLAKTKAFNLESGTRNPQEKKDAAEAAERAFARFPARPMTVDEVLASIVESTGIAQTDNKRVKDPGQRGKKRQDTLSKFITAFEDDEQGEGFDFEGSIPAALLMMNGKLVQDGITTGATIRKVADSKMGNGEKIDSLYLSALGRKPTTEERSKAVLFVGKGGDRREAFEDLLWALLNSSEFSTVH